ncbi:MAG: fatty acid desaturase [Alphaproteobacteria bacterium]|nr:fatty acid desaturase [Alphaproteobacteria bacterium]
MNEHAKTGTEFRDDERRATRLPPETVKRLTAINPVKSSYAALETLAIIAAAISASIIWWTPWVVIPAIIVIAGRQQACFVLAHDAAHYRMFENRALNDVIGRAFATIVGISMCTYRVLHRLHHNHLYEDRDPDTPLHGGYPRGGAYLVRKLAKDLAGLTAYKTYSYFFGAPAINDDADGANRPLDDTSLALRKAARQDRWFVAAFHIAAPIVAFSLGYGVEYLVLWILPLVTVLQALLRFRAICEHGAVTDMSSPLTAARTNIAPAWLRWWMFPHHVNYHVEHHLYPSIPHYNLPACHAEMKRHGLLEHAEVRNVFTTARLVVAPRPSAPQVSPIGSATS